jgi:hypothetical protein
MNSAFLSFETAGLVSAVAVADLNQDGIPDALAADQSVPALVVFRGIGDGRLGSRVYYPVGMTPTSLATGDFDGDGFVDVAVACSNAASIAVFRGLGDGTLGPRNDLPTAPTTTDIVSGDLNGDGVLDLLGGSSSAGRNLVVHLGMGDASFAPLQLVDSHLLPRSIALGYVDADTVMDVVLGTYASDSIAVLLGAGDGTFVLASLLQAGLGSVGVALADLNSDHILDITAVNRNWAGYSTMLGQGDGTFGPRQTDMMNLGTYSAVTLADLNGDSYVDRILSGGNLATLVPGDGAGGRLGGAVKCLSGSSTTSTAVGDLNGDGLPDLVAGCGGSVAVILNEGTPVFQWSRETSLQGQRCGHIAAGDFDEDGVMDLVLSIDPGAGMMRLLGNGDGTFGSPLTLSSPITPWETVVNDFNRDGHLDVAVLGSVTPGVVGIHIGKGDGTFYPRSDYACGARPMAVRATDLNGDSFPDLVVANLDDRAIATLLNLGTGGFGAPVAQYTGFLIDAIDTSDLNGDGLADVVGAGVSENRVSILLGNGDGTLASHFEVPCGVRSEAVAIGDFDGDAVHDLVIASGSTNTVGILLGLGSATYAPAVVLPAGADAVAVTARDVSGDGIDDIIVVNEDTNTIGIITSVGDGTFENLRHYGVNGAPRALVAADLDGDQMTDVATTNALGKSVSMVRNRGIRITTAVGVGMGSVQIEPEQPYYAPDVEVTLEAFPDDGWVFAGWSGLEGATNPLVMTSPTDTSLVAEFSETTLSAERWAALRSGIGPVRPNPASAIAYFDFALPSVGRARLDIIDVQGRVIHTILDADLEAGLHSGAWNVASAPGRHAPGIFLARLTSPDGVFVRRFAVLR